jgi:hypothetical protein
MGKGVNGRHFRRIIQQIVDAGPCTATNIKDMETDQQTVDAGLSTVINYGNNETNREILASLNPIALSI